MATRTTFGSMSSSGENQIDLIDVVALVLTPIAASMIFGVFTMGVNVFGGYDFTSALWTVGGANISVALLIASGGGLWILVTNVMNEKTQHEGYELAGILVAILSPIAFVFVPAFESLVMWHGLTQVMFTLYVGAAAVWVSYTG